MTTFEIGESVQVSGGPGHVSSTGYYPGDAILVKFPDGHQQAYTPHELEKMCRPGQAEPNRGGPPPAP